MEEILLTKKIVGFKNYARAIKFPGGIGNMSTTREQFIHAYQGLLSYLSFLFQSRYELKVEDNGEIRHLFLF